MADVILNYDLKIKYRPGVLHVIPDAISRMYANAYVNKQLVWGTVSNIKFLDNVTDIMKDAVSSEAKIIESLKSVKPPKPKPTRRFKAQGELESGGGDQQAARAGLMKISFGVSEQMGKHEIEVDRDDESQQLQIDYCEV